MAHMIFPGADMGGTLTALEMRQMLARAVVKVDALARLMR